MWDIVSPARFPKTVLRFRNDSAARQVGLEGLSEEAWREAFALFEPLKRNLAEPLALRYHGHQFGVYNPHLGDGRGFLFAQLRDDRGRLLDLATKGSGTTPWSRGGDGRLTLKGGIREVLAAEMLESLGVPTSRAFSLFETGEPLMRGDEPSPTRSSVLVRLGHSHVRFGTFQRLARLKEQGLMMQLVDFCVEAYYPELESLRGDERVLGLLEHVARASATLAARWMAAGFVHGVLNTDNMTITGESFDYGPWRFVPDFDPTFVAAYFDGTGLYAFGRQPAAVEWNVARLADALRLIAPTAPLGSVIATFAERYERALTTATLDRLGVVAKGAADREIDDALARAVWAFLDSRSSSRPRERNASQQSSFERFFFDHFGARTPTVMPGLYDGPRYAEVRALLDVYEATPAGRCFDREGPCTMLIDEVEAIWDRIAYADDFSAFEAKIIDIRDMGVAYGFRRSHS